jgi:hypothetical protein
MAAAGAVTVVGYGRQDACDRQGEPTKARPDGTKQHNATSAKRRSNARGEGGTLQSEKNDHLRRTTVDAGSSIESCGGQRAEGLGALPGRGSAPSLRAPLGTHDPAGILPFSLGQISASVLTSGQTPTSFGSPATRDVTTLASCFPHAEPSRPPTS